MTVDKRLTPKQRREIRQKLREKEGKKKAVRLLNRPDFQFGPRLKGDINSDKIPRATEDPGSIMKKPMQWDYRSADCTGDWSWGSRAWSDEEWERIIHPHFSALENLSWGEIYAQRTGRGNRHKKNHDMSLWDIHTEAFNRWLDIGLDQYEILFRFRVGRIPRVWGYRIHSTFFLIWWDKKHKIYPVEVP